MEAGSMFLSFERYESHILQVCQCFHIALGKETELSAKSKTSCQSFSASIRAAKLRVPPRTENQPPVHKGVTIDNSIARFAA